MRNKLSVQQGEEGDEEDDEMDASAKDKQWGKSKRGYYGADTEDYEVFGFLIQITFTCVCLPASARGQSKNAFWLAAIY